MSENKTRRATVAFIIVRDEAHQAAFAKAVETLGVDWGKALPLTKIRFIKVSGIKNFT